MKKHILFIQPTIYDFPGKLHRRPMRLNFVALTFPLLAALTPPDWKIDICLETIEDIPWDTEASLIAISGMGHGMVRGIEIAAEYKRKGKTIVWGGYMPSLLPRESLEYGDCVVIGDAEGVWEELLNDFISGNLKQIYEKKLKTLSHPVPRYDLITSKRIGGFLPVQAGRGCPHVCTFCSVYCRYRGNYIRRDISEVVRDIKEVKKLGFRRFLLLDDNLASDLEHLRQLCQAIKPLEMKWMSQCTLTIAEDRDILKTMSKSGCIGLGFGLESLSSKTLNNFNKGWMKPEKYKNLLQRVQKAGIEPAVEMIIGAPGDTLESLRDMANFINNSNIFVIKFFILTPIPGTAFYDEAMKKGLILDTDYYQYNPSKSVLKHKELPPEVLEKELWNLYESTYSLRSILRRNLAGRRWWREPKRYLFNLFVNFYYKSQIKRRVAPFIV